jgi:hypothetical protein
MNLNVDDLLKYGNFNLISTSSICVSAILDNFSSKLKSSQILDDMEVYFLIILYGLQDSKLFTFLDNHENIRDLLLVLMDQKFTFMLIQDYLPTISRFKNGDKDLDKKIVEKINCDDIDRAFSRDFFDKYKQIEKNNVVKLMVERKIFLEFNCKWYYDNIIKENYENILTNIKSYNFYMDITEETIKLIYENFNPFIKIKTDNFNINKLAFLNEEVLKYILGFNLQNNVTNDDINLRITYLLNDTFIEFIKDKNKKYLKSVFDNNCEGEFKIYNDENSLTESIYSYLPYDIEPYVYKNGLYVFNYPEFDAIQKNSKNFYVGELFSRYFIFSIEMKKKYSRDYELQHYDLVELVDKIKNGKLYTEVENNNLLPDFLFYFLRNELYL